MPEVVTDKDGDGEIIEPKDRDLLSMGKVLPLFKHAVVRQV